MPESKTPIGRGSMRRFYERLRWADEGAASGRVCGARPLSGRQRGLHEDRPVRDDGRRGRDRDDALPPGRSRAAAGGHALPRDRGQPTVDRRGRREVRGPRLHRVDVRLPRPRAVGRVLHRARPARAPGRRAAARGLAADPCAGGRRQGGAWRISLGGGAALRAAGEGTPFKALEVVETWTDLYEALVPQGLPKSGAIFQFLGAVPRERQGPEKLEEDRKSTRLNSSH